MHGVVLQYVQNTELNSEYFDVQEENALFVSWGSQKQVGKRRNLQLFKETMISVVGHAEVNVRANSQLNLLKQ